MLQRIELIGRLGRKPEMRYTPTGQAVTSFSVATDNKYTNAQGEQIKETTWFRVQVWGKNAENCNVYLDKGSLVFVAGRMVADKSTGNPKVYKKQDESYAANFEINASEVKFLSSAKSEGAVQTAESLGGVTQPEDEVPF